MKRSLSLLIAICAGSALFAQGGDAAQRAQAEALFAQERFADAMPLYSQLVSLTPSDRDLNYRLGTCMIHSGGDKEKAVGFLKFATQDAGITPLAFYQLGRAFHVTYRFTDALAAYGKFKERADKKALVEHPVEVLEKQCRNGTQLLSNLKEIEVHSKVEVDEKQFDRFYDLTDMGGRIIEVPDELMSSLDRKSGRRSFLFKPDKGGTIYFSSFGKDGKTGRDIYTTELLPSGTFAPPRKLAGYVNTDQDEDFAFLHADGKTFYFSSKGHNSMGGYDVFRTSYDKGLDVFGTPENLDFAVNTPDDDVLYIVDPEGKEACFASARDSRQGNIHVYRVSTSQQPLDLVILKGQYLSEIDAADRKAHIIVEDVLTRQQVADVRTGLDGTYVLSLPHSGRYKFMVEAGPGGRTHVGMVEAPRVDAARAYRQELILQNPGGQEKLLIKNYFNEPLADDLIALALDEIKRRARLDVTQATPVAEAAADEVQPSADVMTQAGFSGDITPVEAVKLAQDDAKELKAQADDLREQSGAAFTAALEAAADAEKATNAAAQHIKNADATSDEAVKSTEMSAAALERERARTANLRAKAALRAGQDLEAGSMAVTQRAVAADRLSTDLSTALNGKNDATSVQHLTALKKRLDEKSGPEADMAVHERTRRAMVEKEREAARALQAASAQRDEEGELVTRIGRLREERGATKSKSKQEELDQQVLTMEGQLATLREETARAFVKARSMENETAVMRSEASLMKTLDEGNASLVSTDLTATQVSELGLRLSQSEQNTAALPIDERFEAAVAEQIAQQRKIANDWSLGAGATASDGALNATQTIGRSTEGVDRLSGTQTQAERDALVQQPTGDRPTTSGTVPSGVPDNTATMSSNRTVAEREDPGLHPTGRDAASGNAPVKDTTSTDSAIDDPRAATTIVPADSAMPTTPDPGNTLTSTIDPGQQRFLKENELAELEQLRAAEKNKDERARLDLRIAALRTELARAPDVVADVPSVEERMMVPEDTPTLAKPALIFERGVAEPELIEGLFANYDSDKAHAVKLTDAVERANASHGLELMLMDSIQAETERQTTVLENAPERADEVLPRIERLRQMRMAHTLQAERYLKEAEEANDALARNIDPAEDYAIDPDGRGTQGIAGVPFRSTPGTAHVDAYIAPARDPEFILESPIDFRSNKVADAIALHDQDVEQILRMEEEIDSLEIVLEGMSQGKEYDKIRKRADKIIDDRMILRTEMGARSGYLSKQEYDHANDSLREVRGDVGKLGLSPDEPLVQMAKQMEEDARTQFTRAQQLRKQADRTEDIVVRDSLFREAYGMELLALRGMDQSITVNNYMLSADFARGRTLTYAAIEQSMFGTDEPLLASEPERVQDVPAPLGTDTLASADRARTAVEDPSTGIKVDTTSIAQPLTVRDTLTGTDSVGAVPSAMNGSTEGLTEAVHTGQAVGENPGKQQVEDNAAVPEAMPVWNSMRSVELTAQATDAGEDAQYLERRSIALADSANALRDSAGTAKRRDREALEQQALLAQQRSEEFHARSLAAVALSDSLSAAKREVEQAQLFRDRLNQFYYLSSDEQIAVMGQTDQSRYFQARSLALDQRQRSDVAKVDAIGSRQLAMSLQDRSKVILARATGAQGATTDEMAQAMALDERAAQLNSRADSLDAVAARLAGAANMNESQAASLLQGLPAERSTAIMALEQRTRRTEPMLAEARSTVSPITEAPDPIVPGRIDPGSSNSASEAVSPPVEQPRIQPISTEGSLNEDRASRPVAAVVPSNAGERGLLPPLEADVFTLLPTGDRSARSIELDGPMPAGLVYKVQIGAFRFPIPEDLFSDMTPISGETVGNGMVRYMAGMFTNYGNADNAKEQVRDRGYRDAFVVAYLNGKRISLTEARNAQGAEAAAVNPERTATDNAVVRPTEAVPPPVVLNAPPVQTPVSGTTAEEGAAVLANYPPTADQLLSTFVPSPTATDYYNVPGAAPAKQVETIKGLFYTVQVGVYSKPVPLDKLFNITPLNSERTETAKVRYTTGVYLDLDRARVRKDATVGLGVKDAFITAYLNGKRIPMRDARALIERFGATILADPSLVTP